MPPAIAVNGEEFNVAIGMNPLLLAGVKMLPELGELIDPGVKPSVALTPTD